jgi:hypothetical protein
MHDLLDRALARRVGASLVATAIAVSLVSVVAPIRFAYAQSDDNRAGARAAATEGAAAMQQGNWAQAVDLFTRAESLVHAPPHLLYIARASAKLGKLVRAHEIYLKILRETLAPNAPKAFVEAQAAAVTENGELEARIPTINVVIEGDAKDVTVMRDGAPVSSALIGVPHPVDPGEHKYQAVTKSGAPASDVVAVIVAEGAKQVVTLVINPGALAAASAPIAGPSSGSDLVPPPETKSNGGWMRPAGFVGLGVGVVGVAIGTVFVIQNHSKRGDANTAYASCGGASCNVSNEPSISALDKSATNAEGGAWTGYIVGGVGLAAGATLLILSSQSHSHEENAAPQTGQLHPWFGGKSAGIMGTF